jgi:outer membrane protein insertion porin family
MNERYASLTAPTAARASSPAAARVSTLAVALLASTTLANPALAQAASKAWRPGPLPASAAVLPPRAHAAGGFGRTGRAGQLDHHRGRPAPEADTIRSYIRLREGDRYTQAAADQVLKDLFATELFSDVQVRNNAGAVTIQVKENPVVNRIILEGNKRLKEDKILPEIKLSARQIFTRSKVRADVSRIIELYKRQGRFAASVEPKMVMLDQNRVDIVFEITEGPKSRSARSTSSATRNSATRSCVPRW